MPPFYPVTPHPLPFPAIPPLVSSPPADTIMVDPWEAEQQQYTRTLHVLQHVQRELAAAFDQGEEEVRGVKVAGGCQPSIWEGGEAWKTWQEGGWREKWCGS